MDALFDQAGTALLDFAERAESNAVQGRFFEAMGQLQRKRIDIEDTFLSEITRGFDEFGHMQPAPEDAEAQGSADAKASELSLVEPEEMEERVATENVIIKANANCFPELYALGQRLAVVNGGKKLSDYQIPAGPNHLVRAFRKALGCLEVDIKIKIILYALFERLIGRQALTLYAEFNEIFKNAGVLPHLKSVGVRGKQVSKDPSKPARPGQAKENDKAGGKDKAQHKPGKEAAGAGNGPVGPELLGSIMDLMSNRRDRGDGKSGRVPAKIGTHAQRARPAEIVETLNKIQQLQAESPADEIPLPSSQAPAGEIPDLEVDPQFVQRVKDTLSKQRDQVVKQISPERMSPMDADTIDLIGMLFEYMLNDPQLPNIAKALLSHLHTPYLKVAMIDQGLLTNTEHPARMLLDSMVEAGSLWVDERNPARGIYPAMETCVNRVLKDFRDDVKLFDELLAQFNKSCDDQRRRSDNMEQRTQEAARGRERLQLAKDRAAGVVTEQLTRYPLPSVISGFLKQTWMDLLVFILLRDSRGEAGAEWKQLIAAAKELVDLFDPDLDQATRDKRIAGIPQLRKRIHTGVKRMGSYSHVTLDGVDNLLKNPDSWGSQETKQEKPKIKQQPPERAKHRQPNKELTPEQEEMVDRLRRTRFGTWFELSMPPGQPPKRIKLSWISQLTATCMFVDRAGMQAEVKTLPDLAVEMLEGRARIIPRPSHPFIERAMLSIRKMLKSDPAHRPS